MGAKLVEGRAFTAQDTPDGEAVVIVDQTLARRFYPPAARRSAADRCRRRRRWVRWVVT